MNDELKLGDKLCFVNLIFKNDIGYNAVCYAVKTKYGFMCSLDSHDILTYMGDGIWDLRIKEKSDDEKSFE
ncbi:hypothetical protein [Lactobacillus gasseri]|uniref:hypothetical protein n=1 Tax=Lactobacillus gasseri TaxID=1596 RepID=UPI001BFF46EA|nr:hypothetical protein [Lactobacillus gasseri]